VLHYSTDYVFDGSKDTPYRETDPTCPINVYGRTKLAGDEALLAAGCAAVILRVSWVYGMRGHNFLLTMRRLMTERDRLRIVDDQIGAPTWCRTIAQVSSHVLAKWPSDRDGEMALRGVYHLAPSGSTSWFGFATAIRDQLGLPCELEPIPTSAYPTPAARPPNSRMDAARLEQAFGLTMPTWGADLRRCLA
jgi:dTDP-4-dehydrorhamnose reductase